MDTQQAYTDRLDAQMRAADARLDQLEAAARARNARAEMDEISGLRARRDRVRQQVADAKQGARDDAEALRRQVEADWAEFRLSVAEVHSRYSAWDAARERAFNARLDQVDAVLQENAAADAEVAAAGRARIGEARDDLRDKTSAARGKYEAWRAHRADQRAQRELDDAELELEEASGRYVAAVDSARQRGRPARAD